MIRRWLCALGALLALGPFVAWADPLPQKQSELFLSFARDVSGGDPKVMQPAEALISQPPTTLEEIGFYGVLDAPPAERTLRGIISLLDRNGHLIALEDKYIFELPGVLADRGVAVLPDDMSDIDIIRQFAGVDWDEDEPKVDWPAFKAWFPGHVRAIEDTVAEAGYELLSLTLPQGDTLYFWAASPEMARSWRDTALYAGVNTLAYQSQLLVKFQVTAPDWQEYWGVMTYALMIPKDHQGTPEGL